MNKVLQEYIALTLEAWRIIALLMLAALVFGAPLWALITLIAWLVIP